MRVNEFRVETIIFQRNERLLRAKSIHTQQLNEKLIYTHNHIKIHIYSCLTDFYGETKELSFCFKNKKKK